MKRALGRETEAVAALKAAEADKATFCLENDSIAAALLAYLREARTFTGTASELAPHLCEIDPDLSGKLSTKRLGKRLAALWPHLQRVLARILSKPSTAHTDKQRIVKSAECRYMRGWISMRRLHVVTYTRAVKSSQLISSLSFRP